MRKLFPLIALLFGGCESTTQTAIRENEPPAIAFVVAADKGQEIQPVPARAFVQYAQ